jgi:hypothetical protein
MCVYGDSLEISSVATSISDRLSAGGWVVHKWQIVAGGSVWGILIGIKPDTGPTLTEVGSKMVSILASHGVGSQLWDFNKLQAGGIPRGPPGELGADIRIFIGSKQ